MDLTTAVIIATKGRPKDISNALRRLGSQNVKPEKIIISASEPSDVPPDCISDEQIAVIYGAPGSSAQRNRALVEVRSKYDIVIFFDDDFIPSYFWIRNVRNFFDANPDVVCTTGEVLRDGVKTGGIEWSDGENLVAAADVARGNSVQSEWQVRENCSAYGCNMAFRGEAIAKISFDERLPLYGWLEDRDFAYWAAKIGSMVWTDAVWGVHLGSRGLRTSGRRFGYSQVVNPWYLMTKGSMTLSGVCRNIAMALAANIVGSILRDPQVDRWGRLKGNSIGIIDIVAGRWAPEKVVEM